MMFSSNPNQRRIDVEGSRIPDSSVINPLEKSLFTNPQELAEGDAEVVELGPVELSESDEFPEISETGKVMIDGSGFMLGCYVTSSIMGCSMLQVVGGALVTRMFGADLEKLCFKCMGYFSDNKYPDAASVTSRTAHLSPITATMLGLTGAGLAESMASILITDYAFKAFQMGLPEKGAIACGLSVLALGMSRVMRSLAWRPKTEQDDTIISNT